MTVPQHKLLGASFSPPTFLDLLRNSAEHQGDFRTFTFLVDGETEEVHITNRELDRQARAIAAQLQANRLAGQRVLLLYPAGLEFIAALFGCFYAGAIAVTAYPPRPNRSFARIQAIVSDADAKVALTTTPVWQRIQPLLDQTPNLKRLTWQCTDELPVSIEDEWRDPEIGPESLAFLQYTSGSTGTPKGVMLTHANLMHNCEIIKYGFEHTRTSSGVFWLPSYHDMGLVGGILQPLYIGRSNVLMSPVSFLQKPLRWLQAITRYRGSTSGGPNFAFELCVRKISPEQRDALDLSSWKVAFNGAEPIHASTLQRFTEAFGPCGFRPEAFYPCYGLAEATLIVSGGFMQQRPIVRHFEAKSLENHRAIEMSAEEESSRALVGSGGALPFQEISIVDPDTLTRCGEGGIGEIWVRGPSVAAGYWQRPEETKHTFEAFTASGDGPYLRTGDLGFMIEDELFVTGRIKDLIILRGMNHYPQDIEHTVEKSHAALRHAGGAAFSVENNGSARLVVVQEIERRMYDAADEAIAAIRRDVSLEHELYVDEVVLVKAGSIPKTSSGKIQRRHCRQALLAGTLGQIARSDAKAAPRKAHSPSVAPAVGALASAAAQPSDSNRQHRLASMAEPARNNGNGNGHRNGAAKGNGVLRLKMDRAQIARRLLDLVRKTIPECAADISVDASLADLGLDSLQRIELQTVIEESFGGRFPEEVALSLETLDQIVEAIFTYLGGAKTGPPSRAIAREQYCFEEFPAYVELKSKLDLLDAEGVMNPFFNAHEGLTQDKAIINGREFINFSSFNYLGVAGHPAVMRAAKAAIDQYGTSVSASRLVSGEKIVHGELEAALADFHGAEAAIVFASGHATNVTTIGHMYGPEDLILYDALAHNSIVQGSKLSGARMRPFPHNDYHAVDRMLADLRSKYRRVLVAIEGVYSMDGDIADVPGFVDVKKRHKANLLVDEAHSAGVLGRHGRGVAEHFGMHPRDVDLWMGTISKAFASSGGYIAADRALVEYLKYTGPGFVFSTGISASATAAALAAIQVLEDEPNRVAQLHQRSELFLALARDRGINTGLSRGTPIIPVIMGNSLDALQLGWALFERGINVQPILYPAVEESAARLRFFITAAHSGEQIRHAVDVLAEELERIGPQYLGPVASSPASPDVVGAFPPR